MTLIAVFVPLLVVAALAVLAVPGWLAVRRIRRRRAARRAGAG